MPASPKKSQQKLEAGACGRELAGAGQMTLQEADDELRKFDLNVRYGYLTHDHPRFSNSFDEIVVTHEPFPPHVCVHAGPSYPSPAKSDGKGLTR